MPLAALIAAAIPLVWLIPHHYLPWLASWHEFSALALVCLAGLLCRESARLPRTWTAAICLALLSVAAQGATGRILFGGDAAIVALYLFAFAGSMALGHALANTSSGPGWSALDGLAAGTVVSAGASVAVALMQWTDVYPLPLPVAPIRQGDRPYANLAQSNNFSTAVFLGLCALGWLREARRIGAVGHLVGGAYLLTGMVMSGSRTAWLQVGVMALVFALFYRRARLTVKPAHAATLLLFFAVLAYSWPAISDAMLLSGGRGAEDQLQVGLRLPLWQAMLDAVGRQPWWGYGWQQVAAAQLAVALDHAPIHRFFEHAHNLPLDLLLWAGIPIGGTMILLAAAALINQARATADARATWLWVAVLGVIAHAMLEFPLEYAYFLVPVGLFLGALHAINPGESALRVPAPALRAGWLGLSVALTVVAVDYHEAEQNYRTLRLEAIFGGGRAQSRPPKLLLLSQLEAFLAFTRTPARAGMSSEQLQQYRDVATRFPHPPVLLRLALAEGLNDQPAAARAALQRLCAIHLKPRCDEGRESWLALQSKYPVLLTVAAP